MIVTLTSFHHLVRASRCVAFCPAIDISYTEDGWVPISLMRMMSDPTLSDYRSFCTYRTPDVVGMATDLRYRIGVARHRFVIDFTRDKIYRDVWYQDRWVRFGYYSF